MTAGQKLHNLLHELTGRVIAGGAISADEALTLLAAQDHSFAIMAAATEIREHFLGASVQLCGITNAKSGFCTEDCAFCAQSIWHNTQAQVYPLKPATQILTAAREADRNQAACFGIVTSGNRLEPQEIAEIARAAELISEACPRMEVAVSIGHLSRASLRELKSKGVAKVHHNLETSCAYFPQICTSHTFAERLEQIQLCRDENLPVCCGGIFGMGESLADRISLAFTLAELKVKSVPLNFLHPVPGTRLESAPRTAPLELLRSVAVFRFILPEAQIRICGGREENLRSLQPFLFTAGASGIMTGNYLTTPGQAPHLDRAMLDDLGLTPQRSHA